jgi:hypothetical protein
LLQALLQLLFELAMHEQRCAESGWFFIALSHQSHTSDSKAAQMHTRRIISSSQRSTFRLNRTGLEAVFGTRAKVFKAFSYIFGDKKLRLSPWSRLDLAPFAVATHATEAELKDHTKERGIGAHLEIIDRRPVPWLPDCL